VRRPAAVRRGERGAALLLALVLLVLVESAALLLAIALAAEARGARAEADRSRLDRLAESAVEATLARLAEGDASGLEPTELGGGTLTSEVESFGAGRYTIRARARRAGAARTIEVELVRLAGETRILRWQPGPIAPAGERD
jgi:Tfp pilus assembly protein PilX